MTKKTKYITLGCVGALIALMILGCSGTGNTSSGDAKSTGSSAKSSSAAAKTYGVNQPVTQNGITMTLLSTKESKGSEYNKPADGKVFLLCEFKIENNSSKDLAISSALCFDAYVDDTATSQSISGLMEESDKEQLDGTVAAGKKMDGVIAYEIPKNWKNFEINLNPDAVSFFSGKVTFKVKK
jgi:hypothetical protein